jgi:hypothetical protein
LRYLFKGCKIVGPVKVIELENECTGGQGFVVIAIMERAIVSRGWTVGCVVGHLRNDSVNQTSEIVKIIYTVT